MIALSSGCTLLRDIVMVQVHRSWNTSMSIPLIFLDSADFLFLLHVQD
jgi:hypothetical protein